MARTWGHAPSPNGTPTEIAERLGGLGNSGPRGKPLQNNGCTRAVVLGDNTTALN